MTSTTTTALPTERSSALRRLIDAYVNADVDTTATLVTETVSGRSPALTVSSRQELLDAFADRTGAFTDIDVRIATVDVVQDRAIAEWRVSAAFTQDLRIDDITVPATGRRVYLDGATFSDFEGAQISSFRHYFDDAALLEQLLGLDN